jgi:hypothetical protein
MIFFCQKPHTPQSRTETDQWGQVLDFRAQFPQEEGLWWPYQDERDFEGLVRQHLTQFLLQRNQPPKPPDPNGAPPPQAHRTTVIGEVTTRLKELSEERLKGIAQAMLDLARGKDTGVSLTSNRETLAAQTAVCMVDHLAAADVVSALAGRLRGMGRQDARRVADVIDYLLPLNYVPDIVQRLSAQVETAGFGLVENEVVTWTLAEIILAGFDRKPTLFKVLSDGSVRGQAALDYDVGPVPGPGDMPGQTSGLRYAVRDVLLHLLALLEATPQRQGGVDVESEIRDYAGRLRESLKAERTFNGERCTYFVMKLPEESHKRVFHKEVLAEVGTCVPQLFFVELAPYQTRPGEAEMDHYIRRIVRTVREHDERVS